MIHLAADAPEEATENLDALIDELPKGVFHIQHCYQLTAALELDVYAGAPLRGLERIRSSASAMKRSLLFQVEAVRVVMFDQRGGIDEWTRECLAIDVAVEGSAPRGCLAGRSTRTTEPRQARR